jgi:hypothetical protein
MGENVTNANASVDDVVHVLLSVGIGRGGLVGPSFFFNSYMPRGVAVQVSYPRPHITVT